ncbi:hypothetical protein H257_11337 [Aphanomyces astaci]|uniref:CCHC-type domain-containing protein n=1 Tax=Aphanomyces astaci TaxID=112090 RepID=W4G512_APHAT|nr:hypothetical protein H257_11337 [Aphanomyces astaci]ETV74023.1 hypothetical protein H257_11337 [Aphanomyces astaci]|eukprot:XP_009836536.1 hypothetical protein H257_11337 [Aphanomyces astaci]
MDGLNQGPARTQLFRAYPDTFEEAVRIALSESFSSSFAHARAASPDMDVSMHVQASDDRTCFNCGRPGHFSRACPAPRRVASAALTRFLFASPSERVRVKMADGHTASQPRIIVNFPITFDGFDSIEPFYVIDLDERWDLIIGMSWLESHQPWIDWKAKSVHKVLGSTRANPGFIGGLPIAFPHPPPIRLALR